MYEVIYFSRTGNTRKVAVAIADELNVEARHIQSTKTLSEGADVFLGSGLYFRRPSKLVRDFIRYNDFQGRRVALFGTSNTGVGIEIRWMEWLLKRKGAVTIGKFYCTGKFSLRLPKLGKWQLSIRKSRPSQRDLEKARQFVRAVVRQNDSKSQPNRAGLGRTQGFSANTMNALTDVNHPASVNNQGGSMKIEYFHASHYGNGAMVSEEFKKQMAAREVIVNVHHVREVRPDAISPADLYVFSSPGRFGKPIGDMRRFLEKAKLPPGAKYAILTTEPAPRPDKKTGRIPVEGEQDKWQRVIPIMKEMLQEKGMIEVAEGKIFVTGLKGPLEEGWHKKVEAYVSQLHPVLV